MVEDLLANFPTTCVLRVRMPISDDLSHRNFITKIVKYDRVVNVPNSMTCLTEMLPVSVIMAERKLTGTIIVGGDGNWPLCNTGTKLITLFWHMCYYLKPLWQIIYREPLYSPSLFRLQVSFHIFLSLSLSLSFSVLIFLCLSLSLLLPPFHSFPMFISLYLYLSLFVSLSCSLSFTLSLLSLSLSLSLYLSHTLSLPPLCLYLSLSLALYFTLSLPSSHSLHFSNENLTWYPPNIQGIYNFCNPGAISHNEVLDLYKKHIDPSYVYTNFSLDEQAQILKAGRSNNTLGIYLSIYLQVST